VLRYAFGPFRLEPTERRLVRDGEPVDLAPKEFDLLVALVERAGELATKDELIARLWDGVVVDESALTVHVSRLRAALGESARAPGSIETVPRAGYRFVAPVRVEARRRARRRASRAPGGPGRGRRSVERPSGPPSSSRSR